MHQTTYLTCLRTLFTLLTIYNCLPICEQVLNMSVSLHCVNKDAYVVVNSVVNKCSTHCV